MFRTIIAVLVALGVLIAPFGPGAPRTASAQPTPFQDYGDAPDSTNQAGVAMNAYAGVQANFPTVVQAAGAPGPVHTAVQTRTRYVLGYGVSAETNADAGPDNDGLTNIAPFANNADNDGRDDGVALPTKLPHCTRVQIQVAVTVFDRGQTFPEQAFTNVWLDFDRSGQWGEQKTCANLAVSNEWAVANHPISLPGPGTHIVTLPAFVAWNDQPGRDMWMRVTLSDIQAPSADGSGPAGGYSTGETEDYRLEGVSSPLPAAAVPPLQVGDFTAATFFRIHLPLVTAPQGPQGPGGVTTPGGDLHEVDVAHLGGSTNGPTIPLFVTVAGSGASARLSSWTISSVLGAPVFLKDGPNQVGYNHQLHVLTPPTSPKLAHEMLVSAMISGNNLWLTTWRVLGDGTFQELDSRGYGANAGVAVEQYTIAHHPLAVNANEKRHQVVTPIVHGDKLRLVTWEINALTGAINGRSDSGDVDVDAAAATDLAAVYADGEGFVVPHYTVSLRNASGNLISTLWQVSNAGVPSFRGSGASGRDIQNVQNIVQSAQNVDIAPLGDTGFLSAVNSNNGSLKMMSWENLVASCAGDSGCQYAPSNISDNTLDMNQLGKGVQLPVPSIITLRAMLRDPLYEDDLYTKSPDTVQAIASVRKVMVTIVALEAVADGLVTLDDEVTVSAAAAAVNGTGASVMGLQEGEVMTLRNLLYGNMMVSAGDATWAISEHVGGSVDGMVDLMNAKAAELGMTNTTHCQEGSTFSAVSYSTARDQAILWEHVYNDPLFLEFAGADSRDVCGTLPGDVEICHPAIPPMTKDMTVYPKLDGHKTGGGGGLCPSIPAFDSIPTCVGGGCLAVQATRLQRPLIITELQPTGQTANRWPDASTLFDYGYRQIFTPDFRISASAAGTASDFGLDFVTDGHAVTAALTGDQELSLCSWSTNASVGQITAGGCTKRSYTNLAAGQPRTLPTRLDMVRISTLEAEGDYLLGRLEGNTLLLRLWRVGEKNF